VKKFTVRSLILLASLLTIVSLAGFCGQLNMPCELISHLRLVLVTMALLILLLAIPTKNKIALSISALAVLLNAVPIAALYLPAAKTVTNDTDKQPIHTVKILQLNLWGGKNKEYVAVVKTIVESNPDVIGFSEITPQWLKLMKVGLKGYPYVVVDTNYGGIAIFSRLPIAHSEIKHYGEWHRPRAIAKIQIGSGHFTVICAHPSVPNIRPELRNGEFSLLAEEARMLAKANPTILAGDLNSTPWSYYFTKLLQDSDLNDTEQGFGCQPTWSAFFPVPLVTIDHCLVSKDIHTVARLTGPKVGSDHLPVMVTLEVRPRTVATP